MFNGATNALDRLSMSCCGWAKDVMSMVEGNAMVLGKGGLIRRYASACTRLKHLIDSVDRNGRCMASVRAME